MNENDGTYTDDTHPNVRVRLVMDTEPQSPYGDVMAHVVNFAGPDRRPEVLSDAKPDHVDMSDLYDAAHRCDGEYEMVARWLRMFHGATAAEIVQHQDGALLIFDSPNWRKLVEMDESHPTDLSDDVTEWRAWLDGDVYGIITERRVQVETTVREIDSGELIREDITPTWEEHDSVWGFYGREYADKSARETLKDATSD